MPKKKPAHNAFYYFMIDYKRKQESKGYSFDNMDEVSAAAGSIWTTLSPIDKQPYETKAKEMKGKGKTVKYTSLEEPLDQVTRRDDEIINQEKKMEREIENMVTSKTTNDEFADTIFYVCNINFYCSVNNKYYPAEIAITRFSLRKGVDAEDVFHVIIDIGEVPIGYRLQAEKIAEESHQIPMPPHNNPSLSRSDIRATFAQLLEFLSPRSGRYPPIFVDHYNLDVARDVFKNFLYDYGYDDNLLKIYSLPYLFFVLRNTSHLKVADEQVFISSAVAQNELDKDIYDFVKGISCPFHTTTDAYPYCSLSKTVRAVYIICDHCCSDLDIELVAGRHIPVNSDPTRLQSRPASRVQMSWNESRSGRSSAMSTTSESTNITEESNASTSTSFRRPMSASRVLKLPMNSAKKFEWGVNSESPSANNKDCPSLSNVQEYLNEKDFPSLGNLNRSLNGTGRAESSTSNTSHIRSVGRAESSTSNTSHIRSIGRGRGRIVELQKK